MRHGMIPAVRGIGMMAVLAAAAVGRAAEPKGFDLSPRWKVGQTSVFQITGEERDTVDLTTPNDSQTVEQKRQEHSRVKWTVLEADESGGGVCKMETESYEMVLVDPKGKKHRIDDRHADDEAMKPLQQLIKAVVDTPLTVHVDRNGRVTKIEGVDRLRSRAGPIGKAIKDSDVQETVEELALLEGVGKSMTPGRSWQLSRSRTLHGAEMTQEWKYVLAGVETIDSIDVAAVSGTAEVKLKPPKMKELPPELKKLLTQRFSQTEGKIDTQIYYDLSRGEVVGRNSDMVIGYTVEISFRGQKSKKQTTTHINLQVLRVGEQ